MGINTELHWWALFTNEPQNRLGLYQVRYLQYKYTINDSLWKAGLLT